nr:hypothetical protein [Rhizobium deserti]
MIFEWIQMIDGRVILWSGHLLKVLCDVVASGGQRRKEAVHFTLRDLPKLGEGGRKHVVLFVIGPFRKVAKIQKDRSRQVEIQIGVLALTLEWLHRKKAVVDVD